MKQLAQLVRPFPPALVHENPSGQGRGSYVAHDVVVQRLLQVVGPYDFAVRQVLRGDTKDGKLVNVVVGVIAALTVTIDGRQVTVEDVGDCESPSNWPHDGARMKDAVSDAIKRCAMRLGLGVHLWAQQDFFLYEALRRDHPGAVAEAEADPREQIEPPLSPPPVSGEGNTKGAEA